MKDNHQCDTFLVAAFTSSGPITECSQCGEYLGSGMRNFSEYIKCGKCGCLVHRDSWIEMGQTKNRTKVCNDCYNSEDSVLY